MSSGQIGQRWSNRANLKRPYRSNLKWSNRSNLVRPNRSNFIWSNPTWAVTLLVVFESRAHGGAGSGPGPGSARRTPAGMPQSVTSASRPRHVRITSVSRPCYARVTPASRPLVYHVRVSPGASSATRTYSVGVTPASRRRHVGVIQRHVHVKSHSVRSESTSGPRQARVTSVSRPWVSSRRRHVGIAFVIPSGGARSPRHPTNSRKSSNSLKRVQTLLREFKLS